MPDDSPGSKTAPPETWVGRAHALREAGRLTEALAAYERALALDPDSSELYGHVGLVQQMRGQPVEAEAAWRQALARDPSCAQAENNLGLALQNQGRLDDAIAAFERSTALKPGNARAHYNLGVVLQAARRQREAIAAFERASRIDPGYAKAHNNLGAAYLRSGLLGESMRAFERAIAADPRFAEAHRNRGLALAARGAFGPAAEALARAITIQPDFIDAYCDLAEVQVRNGLDGEAIANLRRALDIRPEHVALIARLARLLEESNQTGEAESTARRGLRLAPHDPSLNLTMARCERRSARYQDALDRLARLASATHDADMAGTIQMEIGQAHDHLGDSDAAFDAFCRGNALRASAHPGIDKQEFLAHCDALGATAPARSTTHHAPDDDSPVFLIGFPRSGTTLLNQILAAHPGIAVLEERPIIAALANGIRTRESRYPTGVDALPAREVQRLRNGYFDAAHQFIGERRGRIVIDKLPLNLFRLPLILRIFPEAKLLLTVRHPFDVCLSCFMQNFNVNSAMANFFTLRDTAQFYVQAMHRWRQVIDSAAPRHQVVRYEDLVEEFASQTRHVLDFIGVGWDQAVLDYAARARQRGRIDTPSYHQVTQPIYVHARYRWERYARHLQSVHHTLAPLARALGYHVTPRSESRRTPR